MIVDELTKNRKIKSLSIITFCFLLLGLAGYFLWEKKQKTLSVVFADQAYDFNKNYSQPFLEGVLSYDDFEKACKSLDDSFFKNKNFLIEVLNLNKKLNEDGKNELILFLGEKFLLSPIEGHLKTLLIYQLSSAYENTLNIDKMKEVLLSEVKPKILPDYHLYLLARAYRLSHDVENEKKYTYKLTAEFPDSQWAKVLP